MIYSGRKQSPVLLLSLVGILFLLTLFHLNQLPPAIYKQYASLPQLTTTKTHVLPSQTTKAKSTATPEPTLAFSRIVYKDEDFDYSKITFTNNRATTHSEDLTVLVLSSIGNSQSYGKKTKKNGDVVDREFQDLFKTIMSFDYPANMMSLSFLVGDEDEFNRIDSFFNLYFSDLISIPKNAGEKFKATKVKFVNKVTIITAPFIEKDFNSEDRENRHDDAVQRKRRRQIARSRNFNLLHGLHNEKYTVFIDSDIVKINHPTMISSFILTGKDIIVPRIQRGDNDDYDKNSWRGTRTVPTSEQLKKMDDNDWENWDYVPRDVNDKMFHFQTFVDEIRDKSAGDALKKQSHIVKLDSVGGAILFAKSIIYKQGVVFPPNYVIGTTWDRLEGYDGIETEGLCYIAKSLGYLCWGMPNLLAQHDAN